MSRVEWTVSRLPKDITMIRIYDKETQYFEALWEIPEGIEYNSYLMFTEEGGILIDTGPKDSSAFMEALRSIASPSDIKAIVVNHMEPDHSGALRELLDSNKEIKVVSHPLSFKLMESFYSISPRFKLEVKDGAEMQLAGESVKFFQLPWLHWPETIVTYSKSRSALFTGDIFGAYSLPKDPLIGSMQLDPDYLWSMKKYFVNVIGAYRSNVLNAVKKLRDSKLSPEIVLPAHGSAFSGNRILEELLSLYESWATCSERGKNVIAFTSMYGFSEEVSRELIHIFEEMGLEYRIFSFTSKGREAFSDTIAAMQDAPLIVLISSTYENSTHPLMNYLVSLMEKKLCKDKNILVIGTYGWGGGVAASSLVETLTKAGFRVLGSISVRSTITSNDKLLIREALEKQLHQKAA
ncbi:MAG TPA: FprA family A-type flavoprotein [Fervidicoccus fontis]|uniref:FprA family A-type flavoprotein n=1 Tax=Fervidicoccus fontis TaxID=683846 RepID=A0A7C2YZQ6_9CREN|nr:FprA family A-type flavoprotein [Fervidicoccus fontis]